MNRTPRDSWPLEPGVKRFARRAVMPVYGLALAALGLEVVLVVFSPSAWEITIREALVIAVITLAALATLLSGLTRPAGARAPWLVLGVAILSFAFGFTSLYFFQESLSGFPTTADLCWLSFYPLFVAAITLLVRGERRSNRLGITLDAAIVAVASAALGYEVLFNGLISASQVSNLVGGQLSYSVLDLAVLVMLVLICAPSGAALGRAYLVLAAGMLLVLVSDIVVVKQLSEGTYVPGTLLDAGWPAAMVVLGFSSRFGTSLSRVNALRGSSLYWAMTTSFVVALVLLTGEALGDRDVIVIALAVTVLCLIMIRLAFSVRESNRLTQDNESIIKAAGAGIFRVDRDGRIISVNPAAAKMLGWGQEELLGKEGHSTMHHKRVNGTPYPKSVCPVTLSLEGGEIQRVTGEVFWKRDRTSFPVDYTSSPVREGGAIVGAVVVFDDVSRQRKLQDNLRHQADHDHLTGLRNRRSLARQVDEQLGDAIRHRRGGALAIIDLDAFKFVNDSFGHPNGDDLLRQIATILEQAVRNRDVVARLGGDEFAVLLREIEPTAVMGVIESVLDKIKRQSSPQVVASAGVAVFDGSAELTGDDLLICADLALYEAKQKGGDRAVRFAGRRGPNLTWVEQIREAITEDRFVAYSQPIVDLKSGEVAREELLVRMRNLQGDIVPPAAFLPTAERFGLIGEIDRLMVNKGLHLAMQGRAVAVNLSARSLNDFEITNRVGAAVAGGLDPNLISFEVTETTAATNMQAATEFAAHLERLGCELALDDFGTGFGSFTYLRHLPVQVIKIDIDFIRDLPHSLSDYHLVRVLVSLAQSLGQKITAEGVEDPSAINILRRLGVDFAQGFLIGKPQEVSEGHPREPEPDASAALVEVLHD